MAGVTPLDGRLSLRAAALAASALAGRDAAVVETGAGSPAKANAAPETTSASATTTHLTPGETRAPRPWPTGARRPCSWGTVVEGPPWNSSMMEILDCSHDDARPIRPPPPA